MLRNCDLHRKGQVAKQIEFPFGLLLQSPGWQQVLPQTLFIYPGNTIRIVLYSLEHVVQSWGCFKCNKEHLGTRFNYFCTYTYIPTWNIYGISVFEYQLVGTWWILTYWRESVCLCVEHFVRASATEFFFQNIKNLSL